MPYIYIYFAKHVRTYCIKIQEFSEYKLLFQLQRRKKIEQSKRKNTPVIGFQIVWIILLYDYSCRFTWFQLEFHANTLGYDTQIAVVYYILSFFVDSLLQCNVGVYLYNLYKRDSFCYRLNASCIILWGNEKWHKCNN